MPRTSVTVTAQNTFSAPIRIVGGFDVSVSGTFSAIVTVQRSEDSTTWRDVKTWTLPSEEVGYDPILTYYRLGVKTAEYTSGTVVASINGYDVWPNRL